MKTDYYVYALCDPRKPGVYEYGEYKFEFEPFYIGKGCNGRCYIHLNESSLKVKSRKNNKIKSILKKDLKLVVVKVKENLIECISFKYEMNMIKTIGRVDLKTGPLTNGTDGGEGGFGHIKSEEERNNMSERMRKYNVEHPGWNSGENNWNYGKDHSGENSPCYGKRGPGTTNYGTHFTEAHRGKQSISRKKYLKLNPIERGKNHPLYGVPKSVESKKKMSNSKMGLYIGEKNPMYGTHLSDDQKEHLRKINLGKKQSAETIDKMASHHRKKILINGVIYNSIKDAQNKLNLWNSGIHRLLKLEGNKIITDDK